MDLRAIGIGEWAAVDAGLSPVPFGLQLEIGGLTIRLVGLDELEPGNVLI